MFSGISNTSDFTSVLITTPENEGAWLLSFFSKAIVDSMMSVRETTICDLPDELILEMIQHLESMRSHEPQSTAFKDRKKEKTRQRKNRARQLALHSLCLTDRRLRRIATPFLYSSFLGSATWQGFKPLELFHRTISSQSYAVGMDVHLGEYLQYVENRLSDYQGNSLYDDTEFYGAIHMVAQYFYLLSDIVRLAPRLRHLSVVSLETDEISFWNYILPGNYGTWALSAPAKVAKNGLGNLHTLCFQIHTEGYGFGPDAAWFRRICSAMAVLPNLTDVRASGVSTSSLLSPLYGPFKNLQRLEITECVLDFEEVVEVLDACDGLRHIACEWAFLNCGAEAPSDLYPSLLRHSGTLETLLLDMREVRFNYAVTVSPLRLGSLRPFANLCSATICETSLLGEVYALLDFPDLVLEEHIVDLLPINLQSFTLLLHSDYAYNDDCRLDDVFALWNLADDSQKDLLKLQDIYIKYDLELSAPNLEKAFEEAGLHFTILRDAKAQSCNENILLE